MSLPALQRSLLVIGPGEHFGLQLARRFAAEGFAVGLVARTDRHTEPIARDIRARGGVATVATADVTDSATLKDTVGALAGELPPLSCLIYNVKASIQGSALELEPDALTECLAANVSGALAAVQAARPWLRDRRRIVILTGGGYKDRPNATKLALSVSKAAQHSLFRAASPALLSAGISLRTLVIDGVVREKGPLFPDDIADAFWALYADPTQRSATFPRRASVGAVSQLGLFGGRDTRPGMGH